MQQTWRHPRTKHFSFVARRRVLTGAIQGRSCAVPDDPAGSKQITPPDIHSVNLDFRENDARLVSNSECKATKTKQFF